MGWPSEVGYSISCSSGMAFMRAYLSDGSLDYSTKLRPAQLLALLRVPRAGGSVSQSHKGYPSPGPRPGIGKPGGTMTKQALLLLSTIAILAAAFLPRPAAAKKHGKNAARLQLV